MTSSRRQLSTSLCCRGVLAVLTSLAVTVCCAEPEINVTRSVRVNRDVSRPPREGKYVSPRADSNHTRHTSFNLSREETIAKILNEYEAKVPPNYESDIPTDIFVQIYILSFDTISESSMDYSLTMFLRQSWHDHRLEHEPLKNVDNLELDTKVMSKVWVPDLYFVNEKRAAFHDVTVPNRLMHIYPNGTVKYSIRISMTLSCDMNLRKYPFDTQTCAMNMESYGYSTKNAVFYWSEDGVTFRDGLSLPQFELAARRTYDCTAAYYGVNYTCIGVSFDLVRSYSYHLSQVYVPSVLIVTLSWVSFWLDIDAVPARISLGLLTVLTMTTQSSGARANLPRVSYIKAIDVWMAMCLVFVFAALVEFAYVNVMSRVERRRQSVYGDKPPPAQAEEGASEESDKTAAEGKTNGGRRGRLFRRPFSKSAVRRQKARRLDKISRIVFPVVFLIFNFVYWMFYMLWDGGS